MMTPVYFTHRHPTLSPGPNAWPLHFHRDGRLLTIPQMGSKPIEIDPDMITIAEACERVQRVAFMPGKFPSAICQWSEGIRGMLRVTFYALFEVTPEGYSETAWWVEPPTYWDRLMFGVEIL